MSSSSPSGCGYGTLSGASCGKFSCNYLCGEITIILLKNNFINIIFMKLVFALDMHGNLKNTKELFKIYKKREE
ncbi:MAG: hypothetical protein LBJ93_01035 [Clostridiales bacterium]|nr:hypothetical protein [Clostridiales bacterium]